MTTTVESTKLSVLQESLSVALNQVVRAASRKSPMPITECVLIETTDSNLTLQATNLEFSITRRVSAEIDGIGATCVNARQLLEIVRQFPPERIDMELIGNRLQIKCGKSKVNLATRNTEDFPTIPQVDPSVTVQIDPQVLRDVTNRVAMCVSHEESRQTLHGVHISVGNSTAKFTGTDGFHAATEDIEIAGDSDAEFLIRADSLKEVARLQPVQIEDIEFGASENGNHVVFRLQDCEFTSTLMQGSYPNVKDLWPREFACTIYVGVEALKNAVQLASTIAKTGSNAIRLRATANELYVSSVDSEDGDTESVVDIGSNLGESEEFKKAFYANQLLDLLNLAERDDVANISITENGPCLFTFEGIDGYQHIIMPVNIVW